MLVRPRYPHAAYLFLYMPGVLVASYLHGILRGAIAALASTVLADLFILAPYGPFFWNVPASLGSATLFLLSAGVIALRGARYRTYRRQLEREIEERSRRERHARFLTEIMVEFSRQRELDPLLHRVAQRCTEVFGEWCAIATFEEGRLRLGALYHADAEKVERLRALVSDGAVVPGGDPVVARLLDGDAPLVLSADDAAPPAELVDVAAALRDLEVRRALGVPLCAGGEAIGVLAWATWTRSSRASPRWVNFTAK
ncbi:MAG: DUF4118 domain-containing protein [Armatimonadota bacterium]|nr:DUF4118 domain-containing protein [Armatimonadota bacterium]